MDNASDKSLIGPDRQATIEAAMASGHGRSMQEGNIALKVPQNIVQRIDGGRKGSFFSLLSANVRVNTVRVVSY